MSKRSSRTRSVGVLKLQANRRSATLAMCNSRVPFEPAENYFGPILFKKKTIEKEIIVFSCLVHSSFA